ncbi:MAG: hypothetical protein M3Z09_10690 [Acidobacteriota bacterium]|nr:hypothetical protein [Acidobacteriota bacterium]
MSSSLHIPNRAGALTPITQKCPLVLFVLIGTLTLSAAEPFRPAYACTEEDLQWAGMTCSERDPCPIYLDLSHVYPLGRKIFATGNLHSNETTLYSIFLASEDGGATWKEPVARVRGGEVDRIQFANFDTGWVSGQRVFPLPGDPFLLLTSDGGKTWRRKEVLPEGSTGFIQRMYFDSPKNGMLVIDRGASDSEQMRYSRYETMTGGESWMIRETAEKPIETGSAASSLEDDGWRARGDATRKLLYIEKKAGTGWTPVSTMALEVARCTGEAPAMPPPPAVTEPAKGAAPAKDYVEELHLGPAPGEKPAKKRKQK